jgi:DNA-directed RNA polymerase specialized sigma24 family protein
MTPTQIAESLGRPIQTVKSQLKRGKLQLLKEFGEKTHD